MDTIIKNKKDKIIELFLKNITNKLQISRTLQFLQAL